MTSPKNFSKKKKNSRDYLKEKMKLEIASELGLSDKIEKDGWGALNAVETGKIGGLLSSRLKSSDN